MARILAYGTNSGLAAGTPRMPAHDAGGMAVSSENDARVVDPTALRIVVGPPNPGSVNKEMPCLDETCRQFLSMSTILFISTVGPDGKADVSPRGDSPGAVKVLNDRTIAIPDRPGNRRADTMSNILGNPGGSVGLIFLVPGVDEVLRVRPRDHIELPCATDLHGRERKTAQTFDRGRA